MVYFRERNMDTVYTNRIRSLVAAISRSMAELSQNDMDKKDDYQKYLRRELCNLLKQNPSIFDINSDPGKGYYYLAYPTEMRVRRYFQRRFIAVQTVWKSKGFVGILEKLFRR